jgi:hypothetical protein
MGLYKPVFGGGSQAGTPTVAVFFDDETVPEDAQEFDCIAWGEVTGGDTGQPSFGSAAYPSFTPFAGGGKVQCPVLRVTGTLTVVRLIAYYSALIETWSVGDGGWQDPDPLKGPPAVALFQKANAPLTSDGTGIYMSWDTLQTIGVAGSTYKVWCTPERPC